MIMTIVTVADMRSCGYCSRGSRDFAKRYGLDWGQFVASGIQAEILLALGDAMADAVVAAAKSRESGAR
jgi:hypothetical protein